MEKKDFPTEYLLFQGNRSRRRARRSPSCTTHCDGDASQRAARQEHRPSDLSSHLVGLANVEEFIGGVEEELVALRAHKKGHGCPKEIDGERLAKLQEIDEMWQGWTHAYFAGGTHSSERSDVSPSSGLAKESLVAPWQIGRLIRAKEYKGIRGRRAASSSAGAAIP